MNMKKTLAGLMAGIVAISAMATVAVSAKAQKAEEVTWSTKAKEDTSAEAAVFLTIPAANWANLKAIKLGGVAGLEIVKVEAIETVTGSTTKVITDAEQLSSLYMLNGDDNAIAKDEIVLMGTLPGTPTEATIKLIVKGNAGVNIARDSVTQVAGTPVVLGSGKNVTAATVAGNSITNVKKDASSEKVGVLLNHTKGWVEDNGDDDDDNNGVKETAVGDAKVERKDTVYVRSLDNAISGHMKKDLEPVAEIADTLKDAKGATIAFNFAKKDIDDSVSDKEFAEWVDRYDWNADAMKSAISLRINNSNVLSVDMMEFDKTNFSAVYSWDEVMSKFQVGSVTGLVHTMGLKINNEKLPSQKDDADKVIDLVLESITVKIPEMADTKDDSMVEDFAAGESATVVEDTLPATTDAPAATDATTAATDGAANPETGNSAIALLAIPAALAAAAIVAKKRG